MRAFDSMKTSVGTPITEKRDLSGIIKDFEMCYELAWKALKAHLEEQGHETGSAKSVFSKAYALGFLEEEDVWLAIIKDRNLTVHTYDEEFARKMVDRIRGGYVEAFESLSKIFPSD